MLANSFPFICSFVKFRHLVFEIDNLDTGFLLVDVQLVSSATFARMTFAGLDQMRLLRWLRESFNQQCLRHSKRFV